MSNAVNSEMVVKFTLDHVQLAMPSGQEKAASSFYVRILGFEEVAKPPELAKRGGAWFRAGAVNIHLGVEEPFVAAKKAHPALRCSDYESLTHSLSACGVEVVHDPLPFQGKRHCYISDPFGNRIEIIDGGTDAGQ